MYELLITLISYYMLLYCYFEVYKTEYFLKINTKHKKLCVRMCLCVRKIISINFFVIY